MISPELSAKIAEWRRKCADKTITVEELREAILAMRGARRSAAIASAAGGKAKASKAKAPSRSADDMLKELEGL